MCVCTDWFAVMELWGFLGGGFKVMFLLLNVRNSQTPTCETNSSVKTHSLKISHGWIMAAQTSKHGFSLSFFFILTEGFRSETVSVEQTLWNKLHNDNKCVKI